jgi:bacteriocin-like protein
MSNVNAEPKPFDCELTEEELDQVSGGGKNSGSDRPTETLTLNFATLMYTYTER